MSIFSRKKKTDVYFLESGELAVTATLEDNFHHVQVDLVIGPGRTIAGASGAFVRCPFDICPEVLPKMEKLRGVVIGPGLSKKVNGIIGGSCGCAHLVDLTLEAAKGIIQSHFILLEPEWPFEDRLDAIKESQRGICHSYSNLDRNPEYIGPRDF